MKTLKRTKKSKAFTLIELMVVILIIAILAAMVVPRIINRTEEAKVSKAMADLQSISKMLDTFRIDVGFYPNTEEGLYALESYDAEGWKGPYTRKPISVDPWGMEYIYENPDDSDSYLLMSLGPDKVESDDDIVESGY